MILLRKVAYGSVLLAALAFAQEVSMPENQGIPGRKSPSVTMSPAPVATVTRGKSNTVSLRFHVGPGFHVNSNQPKSEFLIPTALKLSAATDIVIGRVSYPAGS